LAQLGKCLSSERALLRLRAGEELSVAYAEIDGGNMFNQALGELMAKAEKALILSTKFDGDKNLIDFVREILLKVDMLDSSMKLRAGVDDTESIN
jgi:polyribonucleotide nucleotidyltransferase